MTEDIACKKCGTVWLHSTGLNCPTCERDRLCARVAELEQTIRDLKTERHELRTEIKHTQMQRDEFHNEMKRIKDISHCKRHHTWFENEPCWSCVNEHMAKIEKGK